MKRGRLRAALFGGEVRLVNLGGRFVVAMRAGRGGGEAYFGTRILI